MEQPKRYLCMFEKFSVFVVTFVTGLASSLVHGWALSTMWGWFVIKVFTFLPVITVMQAVGLSLTVSMFFSSTHMSLIKIHNSVKRKNDDGLVKAMQDGVSNAFMSMLFSVVGVGIGWIWLQIM